MSELPVRARGCVAGEEAPEVSLRKLALEVYGLALRLPEHRRSLLRARRRLLEVALEIEVKNQKGEASGD